MDLQSLLAASASRHSHLCPRQVLGVRAALLAGCAIGLELPRRDKRLLVILESDGCFADGVQVVAGVSVGGRTLRVEDYGKAAVVFVDALADRAIRVAPRIDLRRRARRYAPGDMGSYEAMLLAYQEMPADEMFTLQAVRLTPAVETLISHPGRRARCCRCGEEIINEREVRREGKVFCRACAGLAYYTPLS